jgi:putative tricarboxylic transport membrane protein
VVEIIDISLICPIFLGLLFGITVGCLPGLTATMATALAVPFTFGKPPDVAFAFLLGLYCSAVYGGSISAILIHTPGTPASAATLLDGYPMAQKGRGAEALGTAIVSSFFGGIISALILILLAPQVARFALKFGPHEYFALGLAGLTIIMSVSGKSLLRGIVAGVLGLLLSTVGVDELSGCFRFTLGKMELLEGLSFIPVMIGLFALSEVFITLENLFTEEASVRAGDCSVKLPSLKRIFQLKQVILRSSLIGTGIGIIPGAGATIAAFAAYNEARRISKTPEKFGTGCDEGVAAAEAANNGVTGGALIPMLTLGVPGDAVTAILLGALIIHGLRPGPMLFTNHAGLMNELFVILIIANLIMVVIGLIGARFFARVLDLPKGILSPLIIVLCVVGSYSLSNSMFEVWIMLFSGAAGYLFRKYDFPLAPVILGMILGPMVEVNLRRALTMSDGNQYLFFTRPISLVLILISLISIYYGFRNTAFNRKNQAR